MGCGCGKGSSSAAVKTGAKAATPAATLWEVVDAAGRIVLRTRDSVAADAKKDKTPGGRVRPAGQP